MDALLWVLSLTCSQVGTDNNDSASTCGLIAFGDLFARVVAFVRNRQRNRNRMRVIRFDLPNGANDTFRTSRWPQVGRR